MQRKKEESTGVPIWKKSRKKLLISASIAIGVTFIVIISFLLANQWSTIFQWFGLNPFSQTAKDAPFSLHVLDVGKADAMVVVCNGKVMLIDGGAVDGGDTVTAYLRQLDVEEIDVVFNTHPDNDHLAGLKQVGEQFTVNRMIVPDLPEQLVPKTDMYIGTMEVFKSRNVPIDLAIVGDTIWLDQLKVEVLAPLRLADTMNNHSIVLKLTYGDTTFLMMGDAEAEEEQDLLDSGIDLTADVLKVGHHGSATSTTQQFLNAVRPNIAVISVGPDRNNLPKSEVLQRLAKSNVSIYRTDTAGTIILMSDGEKVTVATEQHGREE